MKALHIPLYLYKVHDEKTNHKQTGERFSRARSLKFTILLFIIKFGHCPLGTCFTLVPNWSRWSY